MPRIHEKESLQQTVDYRKMRKRIYVLFWKSKYFLNCTERKMAWIWKGLEYAAPQMPLRHDYVELEANENQQMQKETSQIFSYLSKSRNLWEMKTLLPWELYGHKEDKKSALRWVCQQILLKLPLFSISFPQYFLLTFTEFATHSPNPIFPHFVQSPHFISLF